MSRISSTSTSISISQFLALRVSGLQVSGVQGDRISSVLDQHPDLPPQGVAVGDARSSGTSARSVTRQQRAVMRSESAYVHDPLNSLSAQRVEQIVHDTLHCKPKGETHWSTRSMARDAGVSRSTVARIWRARGLKPHRVDTFKISSDPAFEDNLTDVVGLNEVVNQ